MPPRELSRSQVRQVDRRAIEDYGMSGLVLMENAGRGATDVLCRMGVDGPVVICCGKGNNAGDGFVIARHLDLRGLEAGVLLWADPGALTGDTAANFRILEKTGVPIEVLDDALGARIERPLAEAAWIVDALLGTGAHGEPRPPLDAVIDRINAARAKVLAVDVPSGLDCDTGQPADHTIRATCTCTFVAAKRGFSAPGAETYLGEVYVLDIGVPRNLIEQVARQG